MLLDNLAATSIKKRCQSCIRQVAVQAFADLQSVALHKEPLGLREIPVKRMKIKGAVTYVSAIAHQLAPVLQQNSVDVAAAIIQQATYGQVSELSTQITLGIEGPGWIRISISAEEIAVWLQQILTIVHSQSTDQSQVVDKAKRVAWNSMNSTDAHEEQDRVMGTQYAYARCCAWLRLAEEAGLSPEHISLANHRWATGMVPSHRQDSGFDRVNPLVPLVMVLIDVIDEMDDVLDELGDRPMQFLPTQSPEIQQRALRWSDRLGETVLTVQANIPLMGVIRGGDRSWAEFFLVLMLITKSVLGCILRDWLCSPAPNAL
jgi:hypothetical protein